VSQANYLLAFGAEKMGMATGLVKGMKIVQGIFYSYIIYYDPVDHLCFLQGLYSAVESNPVVHLAHSFPDIVFG